jgi:acyl-CoA thioester hydrolase
MSESRRLVHTEHIKVKWSDMDAFGHVNNVEYFRYMQEARVAWFGLVRMPIMENHQGPVIVDAHCSFLRAIVYPAEIEVALYVGKPGRSSFPTHYDIHLKGDRSVKFAEGSSTVVWIDHMQGKSVPLPDWLMKLLQA